MSAFKDKTGMRFGRLTVLKRDGYMRDHHVAWLCQCDCGRIIRVGTNSLTSGNTKSCGCLEHDLLVERNTKHGLSQERLYGIWCGIKKRCYDDNEKCYKHYGGRGIKVCDEWLHDYPAFREWALQAGYDKDAGHGECTLDRIDVDGDYCPDNCKWVTMKEQSLNTHRNVYLEHNGEKHSITEWADLYGINRTTFRTRLLRLGWSMEEALNIKPDHKNFKLRKEYGNEQSQERSRDIS
jgi:hypothetical protein